MKMVKFVASEIPAARVDDQTMKVMSRKKKKKLTDDLQRSKEAVDGRALKNKTAIYHCHHCWRVPIQKLSTCCGWKHLTTKLQPIVYNTIRRWWWWCFGAVWMPLFEAAALCCGADRQPTVTVCGVGWLCHILSPFIVGIVSKDNAGENKYFGCPLFMFSCLLQQKLHF